MTKHIETLPNGFSFEMLLIEGGVFNMGSTDDEKEADEKPQRIGVEIALFYLAPFTVTQSLWKVVMGEKSNLSRFKGAQHPVENVSWLDTQEFINKLNAQTKENREKLNLGEYRLPTESEWEYAARGGIYGGTYRYAGSDKLKEVGWYFSNSYEETQDVGLLLPNQLGLYDMCGNVWEWVEDHYHNSYEGMSKDGRAWYSNDAGRSHVKRGGSCCDGPYYCRVSCRYTAPDIRYVPIGFRLALSPS